MSEVIIRQSRTIDYGRKGMRKEHWWYYVEIDGIAICSARSSKEALRATECRLEEWLSAVRKEAT